MKEKEINKCVVLGSIIDKDTKTFSNTTYKMLKIKDVRRLIQRTRTETLKEVGKDMTILKNNGVIFINDYIKWYKYWSKWYKYWSKFIKPKEVER